MREILFRGKHKNGFWCYGNLNINSQGVTIITPDETALGKYGAVIPETVGQYTGLTDKNGKKIFEGDICKYGDSFGVVEFYEDDAMFIFTYNENIQTNLSCMWSKNLEVIGNIYDNPELVESED